MKFLIAGLGNIGDDYIHTRHNIGFDILDALADTASSTFELERHAFVTEFKYKGKNFSLIKPTAYVNLSGKAVKYWLQKLKLTPDKLLVVTDDLALPFGKLRLKAQGSHGGHNGLQSIDEHLGTNQYARLRFGIGNDFPKGYQAGYVLSQWEEKEFMALPEKINQAIEIIKSFGTLGIERTMNQYN